MLKNSVIYLGSSVVNRLTPFILIPVLTRFLTPEEYGVVSLYQVAITFGVAICGFGLHLILAKQYSKLTPLEFSQLNYSSAFVLAVSCGLALALMGFLCLWQDSLLGMSSLWWLTIPVVAFASMITQFQQTIYRASDQPWHYARLEVTIAAVNLSLSLLFVVVISWTSAGRQLGIAIATLLGGGIACVLMMRNAQLMPHRNWGQIGEVLRFSLPLMPHTVASAVIGMSDRFFLAEMVGAKELGLYSVGYSFGMVIMLVTDAYAKAWTPWFLKTADAENGLKQIYRRIKLYALLLFLFTIIYSFLAHHAVPIIVGAEFKGAVVYIPVICASYYLFGIYQVIFPFLVWKDRTKILAITSLMAAITCILLSYFLIGRFGAIGAAVATLISYASSLLLVSLFIIWNSRESV